MSNESFWGWSYPNEDDDPWFEGFEEFVTRVGETSFGLLSIASNVIIPPDTVAFSAATGKLTWSGQFEIQILKSGYFLQIDYGPDQTTREIDLVNGDRVYVVLPNTSTANMVGYLAKVNGAVTARNGLLTIGMRKNDKFYANFPTILS